MKEMKPELEAKKREEPQGIELPLGELGEAEDMGGPVDFDKEIQELEAAEPSFWRGQEEEESEEQNSQEEEAYEERRRQRLERIRLRKKREKRRRIMVRVLGTAAVVVVVAAGVVIYMGGDQKGSKLDTISQKVQQMAQSITNAVGGKDKADKDTTQTNGDAAGEKSEPTKAPTKLPVDDRKDVKAIIAQADGYAAQYDYDTAIDLLKTNSFYGKSESMKAAVAKYEETKASLVAWPAEEVTHVFYHSMIVDTARAFDDDFKEADYNQVMTTLDEFKKITQIMYDKGYVMVSIYDLAEMNADGTMTPKEIMLPEGKIPFILSQDDLSYYHYMEPDGYASKLVVDENGDVKNEYVEADGSISVGDYDMVPVIDTFVEEHPDFSYKGAKGIIALTGYNGILGYRTDKSYETRPDDLNPDKVEWLDNHPEFNLEEERKGAKKVADAMRANGWTFASHTWGHKNMTDVSMERLIRDTELFKENVDPLIGGTDIIIFAFGADIIPDEGEYYGEKYEYLKGQGYNYYCNVDSRKYFVQITDNYLRMGRRNLDGYRMYYDPELVEDLFNVDEVFDPARPVPVPPMG